jgi:VIT1/CCC1 family predicted Fe2+/Mn2+ transporter
MSDSSMRSIEKLLDSVKKIYEHKLEKIFGFKVLVDAVDDELVKNLLVQVYSEEEIIAGHWVNRINDLGGRVEKRNIFGDLKSKILLRILGTKGFFEWVLEEEEEGIRELALLAEYVFDDVQSETWGRYASEEIRHLKKLRNQVLGMDSWDIKGTSGARSVSTIYSSLYGGLISTLAFVTGIFGARSDLNIVLVSGFATLVAGSISSVGGAYQSLKAEMDVLVREVRRNQQKGKTVDEERKRLLEYYISQGYSKEKAISIITSLDVNRPSTIENAIDKLGLAPRELGDPIKNAIISGFSYAIAALIPLLPFMTRFLGLKVALIASISGTLISLFCIGAAKSIFSRKKWFRSGFDVMIFGAIASTITFLIGKLVSIFI